MDFLGCGPGFARLPSRLSLAALCRCSSRERTTQSVSFWTKSESPLVAGASAELWPDLSRRRQTGPGLESNRKTGPKRPSCNRALRSGHYVEMLRCQSCGPMSNLEVHDKRFRSHFGHDAEEKRITLSTRCHAQAHPRERRCALLVAIRIVFVFDRFIRNSLVCNHPATQGRRRIQHNPCGFNRRVPTKSQNFSFLT